MKKICKLLSLVLILSLVAGIIAACACNHEFKDGVCTKCGERDPNYKPTIEKIDYVSQLTLDMSTSTAKTEAKSIRTFVDGDTTHFNVDTSAIEIGVLKARYAAIDTPESTGKIEPFGKKASNFTKSKLSSATSIMLESPTEDWKADSTGSRYMCWVWYKTSQDSAWRNLNLEILQEGLAIASNTSGSLYGDICVKALDQAKALKLNVHSGEKDPDMFYGDALQVTLRELRTNIEYYNGKKVSFTGVVTKDNSNGVYVESLDEESNIYFGMYVYYGFTSNGDLLDNLAVGNLVRVVGTVSEFNGTYQVSGLSYDLRHPDDLNNTILLEKGHQAAYTLIDPTTFNSTITLKVNNFDAEPDEDGEIDPEDAFIDKQFKLAELMLGSSVSLSNFEVTKIYTTTNPASSSVGAMTLTGKCNGVTMTIRTIVLYDSDRQLVTEEYFKSKTIDVKGVVDYYDSEGGDNGDYQIKLLSVKDVVVH